MICILASVSPRRAFMLDAMGVSFEVVPSEFEEYIDNNLKPSELVEKLALEKARAVAQTHPDRVVISGDTMVFFNGVHIGKAKNQDEARQTLLSYRGQSCIAVSASAVVWRDRTLEMCRSAKSVITFKDFSPEIVEKYLKTGNYADKAGSFAVQHPLIKPLIASIDGKLDAIIGLPTEELATMLKACGIEARSLSDNEISEKDDSFV